MDRQLTKRLESPEFFTSRYRFVIAGLTLLAHFAVGMSYLATAPLIPLIIADYSINRTAAALLVTLPLLVGAGFGLPGGVIIARMGIRRAYTVGWLLMALTVLSPLTPNFLTLLTLRIAYGVGFALIMTATGPLLMQWFRVKETLIMNGLNSAVWGVGVALSLSIAVPLAEVVGWLGAVGVFGSVSLLGAVAWVPLGRPVGRGSPLVALVTPRAIWKVISNRTVLLLAVADMGNLTQYAALGSWLPSFLSESRGLSLTQSGLVTGLLPFVGIFAVLVAGFVSYRVGPNRNFLIIGGLLIALGGPGTFLFDNLSGIYISIIILGVGSELHTPTMLSLPMELPGMTPEKIAIVWGFLLSTGGFAMFLSPLLVGLLRDVSGSFMPGFAIAALAGWSLFIAGMFMPKSVPVHVRS